VEVEIELDPPHEPPPSMKRGQEEKWTEVELSQWKESMTRGVVGWWASAL
jgi:hypothetical protein